MLYVLDALSSADVSHIGYNSCVPHSHRYHRDFVALHRQGLSTRQIAEALDIPKSTVARHLQMAGLTRTRSESQIAGCARKTAVPYDWSFFPLTPDKAWLLGLIYGDGSLRASGMGFVVTSGDRDVIDNINALFDSRLHATTHAGCWTIQVNSTRLSRELRDSFGLIPCKSASLAYPTLATRLRPHFVRGLLDSDGSWSPDQRGDVALLRFRYTSICRPFVEALRVDLVDGVGVSAQRSVTPGGRRGWELCYSNRDAIAIGAWVYRDTHPMNRCQRKYAIWRQFP